MAEEKPKVKSKKPVNLNESDDDKDLGPIITYDGSLLQFGLHYKSESFCIRSRRISSPDSEWKYHFGKEGKAWPKPRFRHSVNVIGNHAIMFGGYFRDTKKKCNEMWVVNLKTMEMKMAEINDSFPAPRSNHITVVHKGKLFCFGGEDRNDFEDIHVFTPRVTFDEFMEKENVLQPGSWKKNRYRGRYPSLGSLVWHLTALSVQSGIKDTIVIATCGRLHTFDVSTSTWRKVHLLNHIEKAMSLGFWGQLYACKDKDSQKGTKQEKPFRDFQRYTKHFHLTGQ